MTVRQAILPFLGLAKPFLTRLGAPKLSLHRAHTAAGGRQGAPFAHLLLGFQREAEGPGYREGSPHTEPTLPSLLPVHGGTGLSEKSSLERK